MLKGAIFDMDGTLLDSMGIWEDVGSIYLESFGKKAEPGLNDIIFNMSFRSGAQYLVDKYSLSETAEEVDAAFRKIVLRYYLNDAPIKPGAGDFLEKLKQNNVKICLATATDRNMVEPALKRLGIFEYFSAIFTTTEIGVHKGRPDIFRAALDHIGCSREEALVFEDALYAVETAKKDGFKVVGIKDGYCREKESVKNICDVYIENYLDLDHFWQYVSNI